MTICKSTLAVLYYNQEQANQYQLDNYRDRQRAERRFAGALKRKKININFLDAAYQIYLVHLAGSYQKIRQEAS